jgi:hypothetical protein
VAAQCAILESTTHALEFHYDNAGVLTGVDFQYPASFTSCSAEKVCMLGCNRMLRMRVCGGVCVMKEGGQCLGRCLGARRVCGSAA